MAIFFSLVLAVINFVVLYIIIKSAVAPIGSNIDAEIRSLALKKERESEMVNLQLNDIRRLLEEQNELLKQQRPKEPDEAK